MSNKDFNYQMGLVDNHIDNAMESLIDQRFDDAEVHLLIAKHLKGGLQARFNYEKESLSNLAQALV